MMIQIFAYMAVQTQAILGDKANTCPLKFKRSVSWLLSLALFRRCGVNKDKLRTEAFADEQFARSRSDATNNGHNHLEAMPDRLQ